MRLIYTLILFVCIQLTLPAQVNFISQFTGNDGAGNGLFGNCFPDGSSNMFVDWEVFVDPALCGGTGSAGAGKGSDCKVVIRAITNTSDPSSLIASNVVCEAPGIYNTENGNNDVYFANLNVCGLATGRYSIEIHCDCLGGDYDNQVGNPTAATTWDYAPPDSPTYYYGGTAGNCGEADGLDSFTDGAGGFREADDICGFCGINPQLEYFTVGDAGFYRSMVVINGLFIDLGKFQPGNPALPASLEDFQTLYDPACVGIGDFPSQGFCSSDQLILDGAEVNVFKNRFCGNADVTGTRLCYRVYASGTPAPSLICMAIPFNDDCPLGYQGGNTFPGGGSCMNDGCALDQRWQTTSFGINLLSLAPTAGNYVAEFTTETDILNCSGAASTVTDEIYTTTFIRLDDNSLACGGCPAHVPTFIPNQPTQGN